jgi:flagellar biosynthesis protein FliQ
MTADDTLTILQDAIQTILVTSSPILISALAIGLFIAFFQALTQIQEMTLTFVPKIVGILVVLTISLPFMMGQITKLTDKIFALIQNGGF